MQSHYHNNFIKVTIKLRSSKTDNGKVFLGYHAFYSKDFRISIHFRTYLLKIFRSVKVTCRFNPTEIMPHDFHCRAETSELLKLLRRKWIRWVLNRLWCRAQFKTWLNWVKLPNNDVNICLTLLLQCAIYTTWCATLGRPSMWSHFYFTQTIARPLNWKNKIIWLISLFLRL